MERAWYIVGMLLNVNDLSDSLCCVTKCSLSDSPVHISLLAFLHVVLLKGWSLPLFLTPYPQLFFSPLAHVGPEGVCAFPLLGEPHIPREGDVSQAGYLIPSLLFG